MVIAEKPEKKYLLGLAKEYPSRHAVTSEIINLNAILNLPKGTEHFLSDIHGEHEAYMHIRRNASGVIRRKVDTLFSKTVTARERAELATLIYYPEEKLDELRQSVGGFARLVQNHLNATAGNLPFGEQQIYALESA